MQLNKEDKDIVEDIMSLSALKQQEYKFLVEMRRECLRHALSLSDVDHVAKAKEFENFLIGKHGETDSNN